jgi:NADPH:quinone reductase
VEVKAAALAWSDVLQSQGRYAGPVPDPPFVGGHEFSGVVVEAPPNADMCLGTRVFGFLPGAGAFGEYLAAQPSQLRRTPDGLDDVAAAAVSTPFLTADVALVAVGRITQASTVVIHAGAGGVGRGAIQLARRYGVAQIIATAGSPARRRDALAVGADESTGYEDFAAAVARRTSGRGADVILESIGGSVFDASTRALAPMGRLVTIGASSGVAPQRLKLPLMWQRSISVCGLHISRLLEEMPDVVDSAWARVLPLLADGAVDPGVALVISPEEIGHGMDALTSRTVSGRIVMDFTRGMPTATSVAVNGESSEEHPR